MRILIIFVFFFSVSNDKIDYGCINEGKHVSDLKSSSWKTYVVNTYNEKRR